MDHEQHPATAAKTSALPLTASTNDLPAATTSTCPPDPRRVVARLFKLMQGWYGAKFADAWAGVPLDVMVDAWVDGLEGYALPEVAAGVTACKALKWPPTLPEFLLLCRPPTDYEATFHEATQQMALRERGRDVWRSPLLYWAAQRIGPDGRAMAYPVVKARWKLALDYCMADAADGRLPPVPVRPLALPNEAMKAPIAPAVRDRISALVGRFTRTTAPTPTTATGEQPCN